MSAFIALFASFPKQLVGHYSGAIIHAKHVLGLEKAPGSILGRRSKVAGHMQDLGLPLRA